MVEEGRGNREIKQKNIKDFIDKLSIKNLPQYETFVKLLSNNIALAESGKEEWAKAYDTITEPNAKMHSLLAVQTLRHEITLAVLTLELYELEYKSQTTEEHRKNLRELMIELQEARKSIKPPSKPDPRTVV